MHENSPVETGEAPGLQPNRPPDIKLDHPYHKDIGGDVMRIGVRIDQTKQDGRLEQFERALAECGQSITGRQTILDNSLSKSRIHIVGREEVTDLENQPDHLHMWVHCKKNDAVRYYSALKNAKHDIEKDENRRKLKGRLAVGAAAVASLLVVNNFIGSNDTTEKEPAQATQQEVIKTTAPSANTKPNNGAASSSQENTMSVQTENISPEPSQSTETESSAAPSPSKTPSPNEDKNKNKHDKGAKKERFAYTIMTYNILNAANHTGKSIETAGGCNTKKDPGCVKKRASLQAKIVKGKAGNPRVDILGTQETTPRQYRQLLKHLPGYKGIPSISAGLKNMDNSHNGGLSVIWNSKKFNKFAAGTYSTVNNLAHKITAPWVGLKDKFGNKLFVTSRHFPTSRFGGNAATLRRGTSMTMQWAKAKSKHGTPIIVGDFNDRPGQKTTYCGFTASGLLQNSYDMNKELNPNNNCPSRKGKHPRFSRAIDHIYISSNSKLKLDARNWTHMKERSRPTRHASDHTPVYVTVSANNN